MPGSRSISAAWLQLWITSGQPWALRRSLATPTWSAPSPPVTASKNNTSPACSVAAAGTTCQWRANQRIWFFTRRWSMLGLRPSSMRG
jgi:hypothetical protein